MLTKISQTKKSYKQSYRLVFGIGMYLLLIFFFFFIALEQQFVDAAVTCQSNGKCTNTRFRGADTRCSGCKSCTYNNCCHKSFTDATKHCPIKGWRSSDYLGEVDCASDGHCRKTHVQGRATSCGNCKSCTFANCCYISYVSPLKYCPIFGWRAPDYKGNLVRRGLRYCNRSDLPCPSGMYCRIDDPTTSTYGICEALPPQSGPPPKGPLPRPPPAGGAGWMEGPSGFAFPLPPGLNGFM